MTRYPVARVARWASCAAAACLCVAACSSSSAKGTSPTTTSASAAPSATTSSSPAPAGDTGSTTAPTSGAGGVTFDGDYRGSLKTVLCTGTGTTTTAQVTATYSGDPNAYTGDFGENEFGFEGPDRTEFDSGFQHDSLEPDGNGFKVEGIKATDQSSGKSITLHGTLRCP